MTISGRLSHCVILGGTLIFLNLLILLSLHNRSSPLVAEEIPARQELHRDGGWQLASAGSNRTSVKYSSNEQVNKKGTIYFPNQAFTTLHHCRLHNKTITIPTTPYLVIIGVQKAGTTSMTHWLDRHPQVYQMKKPNRRESHFFQGVFAGLVEARKRGVWSGTDEEFYCWARQRYAEVLYDVPQLMAGMVNGTSPVVTYDKTPAYIHLQDCPEYLSKTCPWGVKILVLLRNPVDRAFSQHEMDAAKHPNQYSSFEDRLRDEAGKMLLIGLNQMPLLPINATLRDIEELVFPEPVVDHQKDFMKLQQLRNRPLLKKGMYAIQLREWLKMVPRSNIFIQFYEDLKSHPDKVFLQVQQFLGLSSFSLINYSHFKPGNYSSMNMVTRRYLERFFETYNRQMEDLLGEPFHPSWK